MSIPVYDFSDYLEDKPSQEKLIMLFFQTTKSLCDIYPDYKLWFEKHINGCYHGSRKILFTQKGGELSGIISLKNDGRESKICTLYVSPEFLNTGVATALVEASFDFLKTTKPYFCVKQKDVEEISELFEKYDWQITGDLSNFFTNGDNEIVLNGKTRIF